jgi:hypothetical protein
MKPEQDPKTGRITKGVPQDTNKNGTAGRPTKLEDKDIRDRFLKAASFNMNIEATCAYAGITRQTYLNYIEKHPEFLDEIRIENHKPYQTALSTVLKAASKDPKIAMQYLERRYKAEFSTRQEVTGADGKNIIDGLAGLIQQAKVELDEHGEPTS